MVSVRVRVRVREVILMVSAVQEGGGTGMSMVPR
jgi:hypothetical protein